LLAGVALIAVELTALGFALCVKLDSIQISCSDESFAASYGYCWCAFPMSGVFVVGSRDHDDQSYDLCDERPEAALYSACEPIGDICSLTTAVAVTTLSGLGMIAVSVLLVSRKSP
jgi:hypothetical protein